MPGLRAVTRGRLRQISRADGGPVDVELYGCHVHRAPHVSGGKTYMTLNLDRAGGDTRVLAEVDDFVRRQAAPAFSPLLAGGHLVVKLPAGVAYETAAGEPAAPWGILTNAAVDVVVRPGAFGDFGYCWLLRRVKPSAAA